MQTPWTLLLCHLAFSICYVVTASLCLGGSDIFAVVKENSPAGEFIANFSIVGEPGANSIHLCLTGENADWFYLEKRTIRLNSSLSRPLDREVQGSILMAALTCYEEDIMQSEYRVVVEILNENDNRPRFVQKTIQPFSISELVVVNSLVFTVKALDADGDTITYVIDQSCPDASYFRIDLPNSGKVMLDKPLDYETKSQLHLVISAVESNTRERYNATAALTITVRDGDDQYPQFLPCTLLSPDSRHSVCTAPLYTANITQKDQNITLEFWPGSILAEDGDKSLATLLQYTILSGDDHGRFVIDNRTGEITLTRAVENRLLTPTFMLRIMAYQVNDPKKYSVTTAVVRVLAENRFPPLFNRTIYKGFLIESSSPAALISTYGNRVLLIHATDQDYKDGVNPKMRYSLSPQPSHGLYHITQEGVLIAKTDRLRAFDRHILEVVATDEESGEVARTSVDIEVLRRGQPIPQSPFGEEAPLLGDMEIGVAGGITGFIVLLFAGALCLLLRLVSRRKARQEAEAGDAITLGKSQIPVDSSCPLPPPDEASYHNEGFTADQPEQRSVQGRYTKREELELTPSPPWPYSEEQTMSAAPRHITAPPPPQTPFPGSDIIRPAPPPPQTPFPGSDIIRPAPPPPQTPFPGSDIIRPAPPPPQTPFPGSDIIRPAPPPRQTPCPGSDVIRPAPPPHQTPFPVSHV